MESKKNNNSAFEEVKLTEQSEKSVKRLIKKLSIVFVLIIVLGGCVYLNRDSIFKNEQEKVAIYKNNEIYDNLNLQAEENLIIKENKKDELKINNQNIINKSITSKNTTSKSKTNKSTTNAISQNKTNKSTTNERTTSQNKTNKGTTSKSTTSKNTTSKNMNNQNTNQKQSGSSYYISANGLLSLVNKARNKANVGDLEWSSTLEEAAKTRAKELTQNFSHTRPDGSACFTVSSSVFAENIAMGQRSIESVNTSWTNSAGHYKNMINSNYNTMGAACYVQNGQYYWVELFGY